MLKRSLKPTGRLENPGIYKPKVRNFGSQRMGILRSLPTTLWFRSVNGQRESDRHEWAGSVRTSPFVAARGGARRRAVARRLGVDRRGLRLEGQHPGVGRRRVQRRGRHLLRPNALSRAAPRGARARVFRDLPSGGRAAAAAAAAGRQPDRPCGRAVHRGGEEGVAGVQRDNAAHRYRELPACAARRAGRLAHRVDARRPGGRGGLDLGAGRNGRAPAAASPPLRAGCARRWSRRGP